MSKLLLIIVCIVGLIFGALARADTPRLPVTHRLSFPESEGVKSAVFGADGKTVYVDVFVHAVNLWGVLVYVWPEVLGGVAGLAALVTAVIVVRVLRRPRRPGVPYCRRCNYDVSGLAGAPCPECGADLSRHRPIIGRTLRRRLGPSLAVCALLLAAYGGMWAARVPRSGRASAWLEWPSTWVTATGERWGVRWPQPLDYGGEKILEVDLASGQVVRTVSTRSARTYQDMAITPDGQSLILWGRTGPERVDIRSGRTRGRIKLPSIVDVSGGFVLGFSSDGHTAYVQWFDHDRGITGVSAWHMPSGRLDTLVETPAFKDTRPPGYMWSRRFLRLGTAEPPRFISVPTFMESYNSKSFIVRVYEPGGSKSAEYDLGAGGGYSAIPTLTPDGARMYLGSRSDSDIQGFDPATGESLGSLSAGTHVWDSPCLGLEGRLLAVPTNGPVMIRDTLARQWIASLDYPPGLIAPIPGFSGDGRWMSAVCQRQGFVPSARGNTHDLVLWNLESLPKEPAPSDPVKTSP